MIDYHQEIISTRDWKRMMQGAYQAFVRERQTIDKLNIFPVSDSDTGTNMMLTMAAVYKAMQVSSDNDGIGTVGRRAADSAVLGARGNSGVILAQMFRGLARGLFGKDVATATEMGKAFQYSILYAYRAMQQPVEGTMLTVGRGMAKGARAALRDKLSFAEILQKAIDSGRDELQRTPHIRPELMTAGVVDAGGQGLLTFLIGCWEGLVGADDSLATDLDLQPIDTQGQLITTSAGEHPFCTEFVVHNCRLSVDEVWQQLADKGGSLSVIGEGLSLKVHLHTVTPGKIIDLAINWGIIDNIKVDNIALQHRSNLTMAALGPVAVLAVINGEGWRRLYSSAGAHILVDGGNAQNPAVEDIVKAIRQHDYEKTIILPNNKNILLIAREVRRLLGDDRVAIVSTTDMVQGLAALSSYMAENDSLLENFERMQTAVSDVYSAAIISAANGGLRADESAAFIAVSSGRVLAVGEDELTVASEFITNIRTDSCKTINLYWGCERNAQQAQLLVDGLQEKFCDLHIEACFAGQRVHHYLIGVK